MTFHVLTVFPRIFDGFLNETLFKKAQEKKILRVNLVNIRDFAPDKHHTTDDTPYGGGPGMVMKIEPIYHALESLGDVRGGSRKSSRRVLLSPRGKQFTERMAEKYSQLESLTLICGRYEGVDQRVGDSLADEELSIGPYVLSGGEVAAMVVMETVSRLVPGFLGNPESLKEESFSSPSLEYPQYTKPAEFLGWKVPKILLSGNHERIAAWRARHTRKMR